MSLWDIQKTQRTPELPTWRGARLETIGLPTEYFTSIIRKTILADLGGDAPWSSVCCQPTSASRVSHGNVPGLPGLLHGASRSCSAPSKRSIKIETMFRLPSDRHWNSPAVCHVFGEMPLNDDNRIQARGSNESRSFLPLDPSATRRWPGD